LTRARGRDPDWLGLSEASRILGVSPATLRRWSDAGRLRVFTTPGGHRRFARAALERLLPGDRVGRPSLGSIGLTPARMARTYRRAAKGGSAELPWVLELTPDQRLHFRERGHLLAAQLLTYLDAADPSSAHHHLDEALETANEYGRVASNLGLSLSQTVEGFLRFRAPFHAELAAAARRRGFDTEDTTELLETAERAMDDLLLATMSGHDSAPRVTPGARRPRPTRRANA
jgi:excisionase family DNA binding protein